MFKYFKYILACVAIVLAGGLLWLQNDRRVHAYIANQIKIGYEQATGCSFDFAIKSINVLGPEIVLEQVHATQKQPLEQHWQWQCDRCTISFSWLTLLLYGTVGLNLTIDNMHGYSLLTQGQLSIINEHIAQLLAGPALAIPIYLKSIAFNNGNVLIKSPEIYTDITLVWSSESKKIDDVFKTNIYVKDGSVTVKNRPMVKHLAGTAYMDITAEHSGIVIKVQQNCTGDLQFLPAEKQFAFIVGNFERDHGIFSIKTPDQTLVIDQIDVTVRNGISVEAIAKMPLKTACSVLNIAELPINGQTQTKLRVHNSAIGYELNAQVAIDEVTHNTVRVCDHADLNLQRNDDQLWHGTLTATWGELFSLEGSWKFDEISGTGSADLTNAQMWVIPQIFAWNIAPHSCAIHVDFNDQYEAQVSYSAALVNPLTGTTLQAQGSATITQEAILLQGVAGEYVYECELGLTPSLYLKNFHYKKRQGDPLISIESSSEQSKQFEGMIKIPLIRSIIQMLTNYDVQGEGTLKLSGTFALPHVQLRANLAGATIRLPQTHNFISDFSANATLDIEQKTITAENIVCTMHRGSFKAAHAHAAFTDSYNFKSFSLPIVLDSCLLNVKKDVFALLSGQLTITKDDSKQPILSGAISIDRSLIHENLFSDRVQKAIFSGARGMFDADSNDLLFDVTLETKNPVRVSTAFVEAQAKIKLHIQQSLQNPQVTGSIDLVAGSLAFPYKPLNIVRGNIFFMPNQLYDPMIELVARNKIKKHMVTLRVTGSLLNPHVALEANPSLTEEQIVGLLLVGAQGDSLNLAVPALIMQNIKTALFESEHSPIKLSKLQNWLKPFRSINLVPSFSDQSGRGGLRGAIEIELNDHVHATIQKNFSLSEDTKFEVEYALSDDVSLRAIRNERKDVGGEVEMRWKFGG